MKKHLSVLIISLLLFSGHEKAWSQNLLMTENGYNSSIYEFAPGGAESTFASGLESPWSMAFNSAGDLFEVDYTLGSINEFTPGGTESTFATPGASFFLWIGL